MRAENGRDTVQYVFEQPELIPDYWEYSDVELARSCLMVAEGQSGVDDAAVRGEARRIYQQWREAINPDLHDGAPRDRVGQLRALRRRTIQILVRLSLQGRRFIP